MNITPLKELTCPICHKQFYLETSLNNHINSNHSKPNLRLRGGSYRGYRYGYENDYYDDDNYDDDYYDRDLRQNLNIDVDIDLEDPHLYDDTVLEDDNLDEMDNELSTEYKLNSNLTTDENEQIISEYVDQIDENDGSNVLMWEDDPNRQEYVQLLTEQIYNGYMNHQNKLIHFEVLAVDNSGEEYTEYYSYRPENVYELNRAINDRISNAILYDNDDDFNIKNSDNMVAQLLLSSVRSF